MLETIWIERSLFSDKLTMLRMRTISGQRSTQPKANLARPLHNLKQRFASRNFAEAWSDLGQARKQLLDDAGALTAYEHAVTVNPRDAVAQYRLGEEYLHQGKTQPAIDHLRQAYELNLSDQSTLNALQMALRRSGDVDGANRLKQQLADLLSERDRVNHNKLTAIQLNTRGRSRKVR